MAKIALLLLALVAVASAKPFGGGALVSQNHVSSSIVSPHYGLGYGMMGYPGLGVGHTISSHSVSHAIPHYGMGMMGLKGIGMYPGFGFGMGYGGYGLMG